MELARSPSAGPWKLEEVLFLRANYHLLPAQEIADALGRTRGMVYKKAQLERLGKAKRWRMPEIRMVVALLTSPDGRPSSREISEALPGRSGAAVEGAITRYRLLDPEHKVFRKPI